MTARNPKPFPTLAAEIRPLLAIYPLCRLHPTIAPLPETCAECDRWVRARQAVADLDVILAGDGS